MKSKPKLRMPPADAVRLAQAKRDEIATKVCVVHAKSFDDWDLLRDKLDALTERLRDGKGLVVRCRHLQDKLVKRWAFETRLSYRVHHPVKDGADGLAERDEDMLAKSAALIAFGEDRDVARMVKLARKKGLKVRVVE